MSEIAIKVENLGKQYQIGGEKASYRTLRESLMEGVKAPFQRAAGLLRGESYSAAGLDRTIWALKDLNFEIKQGEVVGVIGPNGAGKSTLLKILSRITEPSEGRALIRGRIGSLLEVGTGFHPELTGRENIYLNGSILGMHRDEIEQKFDEISYFAEVTKFLDTPVKHYSSGMYVRLAFSVAAHLEPDILLVDEVLSVGDASFQTKSLGKMGDVAKQGRTVLFVSHNISAINHLCSRVILLENGEKIIDDHPNVTTSYYLKKVNRNKMGNSLSYKVNRRLLVDNQHPNFQITDIELLSLDDKTLEIFHTGDSLKLRIHYKAGREFASQAFAVHVHDHFGQRMIQLNTTPISGYQITDVTGKGYTDLVIKNLPLTAGRYFFDVGFVRESTEWIIKLIDVITLDIKAKDLYNSGMALDNSRGVIIVDHFWKQTRLD